MKTKSANPREQAVIDRLQADGFEVLNKGWPDLLAVKDYEVVAVEVKRKQKRKTKKMGLSAHQRRVIEILRGAGIDVQVEYID